MAVCFESVSSQQPWDVPSPPHCWAKLLAHLLTDAFCSKDGGFHDYFLALHSLFGEVHN